MPLSVAQLNSIREEFDFPYAGESIHITYNPQGLTPELERRIQDAMKSEYRAEALVFMLKVLLIDWDLVETAPVDPANPDAEPTEVPFGIEDEKMMSLPVKFLADVTQGIAEEIRKAGEGGNSSAGS